MPRNDWSRRALLQRARSLAAVGLTASVAGCTAAVDDLGKYELKITRVRSGNESGPHTIEAWVRNRWVSTVRATLVAELAYQNGNTYRRSRPIEVPAGATEHFTFTFDVPEAHSSLGDRPSVTLE
ncbi:MAG: hypothetical protein ABEJ28_12420 [Salinigranum sp.]